MASGMSLDSPVLEVLQRRISKFDKFAKTKTLQKEHPSKPIVAATVEELRELRSKLTSAVAEKLSQTMATSVLRTLFRRINKFRKKYDHIIRIEELLASGETLKKEQEEVLCSKPIVMALMKELSELTSRLISALAEELCKICDLNPNQSDQFLNTDNQIEDLLFLVNLACVRSQSEFPVVMLTRRYERGCLAFDYMTDEKVQLLSENDLNFLSFLGPLVSSEPFNEIDSHKSALEGTTTYVGWNDKPKKIMSSEDITVPSDSTKICRHAYLKGDGGSKKKARMEVCAQSLTPKMKWRSGPSRHAFNYSYICSADKAAAFLDSFHYKFIKPKFLTVPAFDLVKNFESSKVRNFLLDAVLFYKLHHTWEIYVCPKPGCFRWFKEDTSLISHLKNEHLPMFRQIDTWPTPQHIPADGKRCVDVLSKMVWKPIHLQGSLDLLSRMYLDHACANKADVCAGCDQFCSLEWPLSKDPVRSKLLAKLGRGFQSLLNKEKKASYSLLSRGYFTKMTVLAFENIVASISPSDKVLFLGCTLAHSPLSFRFLEEKALSFFVHLVSKMCHLVMQGAAPSRNMKLDSSRDDVDWNKSEILNAISFSRDDDCFFMDRARIKSLCCGKGSIPSWLCNAPCYRSITQVPAEASKVFVKVENKLVSLMHSVLAVKSRFAALICEKQWASFRYPWLESGFKSKLEPLEQDQLKLGCELECLEPQVRRLCALDLRIHILPLLRSFCRGTSENIFEDEAGYRDEDSEETRYSDCKAQSKVESDGEEEPRIEFVTLNSLDSTLTESLGLVDKDTGIFLYIPVSDILGHSEQACPDGWKARTWFMVNKSWKYVWCYLCKKPFVDRESHMVHMEYEHQLGLSNDESWLVPFVGKEFVEFRHVGVEGEPGVDSITLDRTCSYCLVNITKFYQMEFNEGEDLGSINHKQFSPIFELLQYNLSELKCLLSSKSKHLKSLEVVNCLHDVLFSGNHSLTLLVTWLHKLSFSELGVGSSQLFQLLFLSRVLEQARAPLSNDTVKHAFAKMLRHLIDKLHKLDQQIMELLVQRNNLRRHLSDLCCCDYRSNFLPYVGSSLRDIFGMGGKPVSSCSIFKKMKNMFSSLGCKDAPDEPESFSVKEVLPGKVIIGRLTGTAHWSFAYIGLILTFEGDWSLIRGHVPVGTISGKFKFSGLSNWYCPGFFCTTTGLSLDGALTSFMKERLSISLELSLDATVTSELLLLQEEFQQHAAGVESCSPNITKSLLDYSQFCSGKSLRWLNQHRLQNMFSSLGGKDAPDEPESFSVKEVLPGKVIIGRLTGTAHWSYAYIGLILTFEGEWSLSGLSSWYYPSSDIPVGTISGKFKFSGLSNWYSPGSSVRPLIRLLMAR